MFVNGGHGGITSIAGTFYPTVIRANGAAWASSVAKVGAMIGPWLGGVLLDAGLGTGGAFTTFALCPVIMVVLLFMMGRAQKSLSPETEGALVSTDPAPGDAERQPATAEPVLTGHAGDAVPEPPVGSPKSQL
jgi:AAHS family 4-hydroxybenzoate transporter-like MFS transporter